MNLVWKIDFTNAAKKQLSKLGKPDAKQITTFLRQRLSERDDPRQLGIAMQGSNYSGLWRYRVGDYRIIASIDDESIRILIVTVGHRREVYRKSG